MSLTRHHLAALLMVAFVVACQLAGRASSPFDSGGDELPYFKPGGGAAAGGGGGSGGGGGVELISYVRPNTNDTFKGSTYRLNIKVQAGLGTAPGFYTVDFNDGDYRTFHVGNDGMFDGNLATVGYTHSVSCLPGPASYPSTDELDQVGTVAGPMGQIDTYGVTVTRKYLGWIYTDASHGDIEKNWEVKLPGAPTPPDGDGHPPGGTIGIDFCGLDVKDLCKNNGCGGNHGGPLPQANGIDAMIRAANYHTPVGPGVDVRVIYEEGYKPANPALTNFGPNWTSNVLTYIEADTTKPENGAQARNGLGAETFGYDRTTGKLKRSVGPRATLTPTSTGGYNRFGGTGLVESYEQIRTEGNIKRVQLSKVTDAAGNPIALVYDGQGRLATLTDAKGKVTSFEYEGGSGVVQAITDPFGRRANFTYDPKGRLRGVVTTAGQKTEYDYDAQNRMSAMNTDGTGTQTYTRGKGDGYQWIEMKDATGGRERAEYRDYAYFLPDADPADKVPDGMGAYNHALNRAVSFIWDKVAMRDAPGDYSKATVIHWATSDGKATLVPLTRKQADQNRTWFAYQNQPSTDGIDSDTTTNPAVITMVGSTGATRIVQARYTDEGAMSAYKDEDGRVTLYDHQPGTRNLTQVTQVNGSSLDTLMQVTYDTLGRPQSVTDQAGQSFSLTYDSAGQISTLSNARGTTTIARDALGFASGIDGPALGSDDHLGFSFSPWGDLLSKSNSDGQVVRTDYNSRGEPTRFTGKPGVIANISYDDQGRPNQLTDAFGRSARYYYDASGRTRMVDRADKGKISFDFCTCGQISGVTDALGHTTKRENNLQGQTSRIVYPDGSAWTYEYDPVDSKLVRTTDAKGQQRQYEYYPGGLLRTISYPNAAITTAPISFTYDSAYRRLTGWKDGQGSTEISYQPYTLAPGSGHISKMDGPQATDTLEYGYDAMGHTTSLSVGGVAANCTYDAMGRLTSETNALGTFIYTYSGGSNRVETLTFPNGQTTRFTYIDFAGAILPGEILNSDPATALLSRFSYQYTDNYLISSWFKQQGAAAGQRVDCVYDKGGRLDSALSFGGDPSNPLSRIVNHRDIKGNRIGREVGTEVQKWTLNSLDQLTSMGGAGGPVLVRGTVSKPANVRVNDHPAQFTADKTFEGTALASATNSTFTITASAPNAATVTQQYQIPATIAASGTLTWDANGNMTSDGVRTFEWDGADRLVSITAGTARTEITYDGFGRYVGLVEKTSGAVTSERHFVWSGSQLAQLLDGSGVVLRRYFSHGFQEGSINYFYTKDHLGSVREITDASGAVVARYDYTVDGAPTKVSGSLDGDFLFAGYFYHPRSGLYLTRKRPYNPALGLFLTRDPIGAEATNLYEYAGGNPINGVDKSGASASYALGADNEAAAGGLAAKDGGGGAAGALGGASSPFELSVFPDGMSEADRAAAEGTPGELFDIPCDPKDLIDYIDGLNGKPKKKKTQDPISTIQKTKATSPADRVAALGSKFPKTPEEAASLGRETIDALKHRDSDDQLFQPDDTMPDPMRPPCPFFGGVCFFAYGITSGVLFVSGTPPTLVVSPGVYLSAGDLLYGPGGQGHVAQLSPIPAPTISPNGGDFATTVAVTFGVDGDGLEVHITADGTDPTASSPVSPGTLNLDHSATIKARAFATTTGDWDGQSGPVATAIFYVGDRDHDGMPDSWELAHGTNPDVDDARMDPDHDGASNLDEFRAGTDPQNPDTNGDGVLDGPAIASGIPALAVDTDGDGISNADEIANGTNPLLADSDGDGVPDSLDAYPMDPTRSQALPMTPGDTTAPGINVMEPANAIPY